MNALVKFALSLLVIMMAFAVVGLSFLIHLIDVEMIKESGVESSSLIVAMASDEGSIKVISL